MFLQPKSRYALSHQCPSSSLVIPLISYPLRSTSLSSSPPVSFLLFSADLICSVQLSRFMLFAPSLSVLPPCPISLLVLGAPLRAHPSSFVLFFPLLDSSLLPSPHLSSHHLISDSRCLLHYLLPSTLLRMSSYRSPRYPRGQ
jgi:hypothetical protein